MSLIAGITVIATFSVVAGVDQGIRRLSELKMVVAALLLMFALLVFGFGALAGPAAAGLAMEWAGPVGLPMMSTGTAILLSLYGAYRTRRRKAPPLAEQSDFVPNVRTMPLALEMYPQGGEAGTSSVED